MECSHRSYIVPKELYQSIYDIKLRIIKIRDINQRKYDKTPIVLCIYGKKSGTSEKKDVNT